MTTLRDYSTTEDIKDDLIKKFTKHSDHEEAKEYVDKVLSKLGIAADTVTPLLKRLSVCYATYKRAFYESKIKDDIFWKKYRDYEDELIELTAEVIKEMGESDD